MAKRDYYEVLGVDRSADKDTLKKAYRKLAMQFHPDRNPGNEEAERKFKELNEAYDVLKDDEKKAAYDRFGHAAFEGGGPRPGGAGFEGFSGGFADIFEEMFGDFMGGGGRRGASPGRGSDLRYNMTVSLEEAFNGKQAEIRVPTSVTCDVCDGHDDRVDLVLLDERLNRLGITTGADGLEGVEGLCREPEQVRQRQSDSRVTQVDAEQSPRVDTHREARPPWVTRGR